MAKEKNKEADRRAMMLASPISRLIPKMAFPTVVAMLAASAYSLANTYFLSRLGTEATAAVGVNMTIEQVILMAGSFLAVGSNSYIARLLGAKQNEKASQTLSLAFFTAVFLGLLFAAGGLFFSGPLVDFLGATEGSREYAAEYANFILLGAPFMASSFVLNQCLRSEGSPLYSMLGMGAGAILNIAIDPIFIFTLDMGVKGAAIATLISKAVSFCILILPYLRKKSLLRLSLKMISFSRDIVREISLMGLPSLLRIGLSVVCFIFLNRLAGSYSDSALAAVSVAARIMSVPYNAMLGFGQGFMPVAGYCWGAKSYDRVKRAFRFSSYVSVAIITAVSLIMCVFAESIILAFSESDADLLEIGRFCLISQCIVMPLNAWVIIVNMLYSALGKPVGAIVLSTTRQGICFAPAFWLLPRLFEVQGLAAVQAAADFLSFLAVIPFAIHAVKFIREREQDELSFPDAFFQEEDLP